MFRQNPCNHSLHKLPEIILCKGSVEHGDKSDQIFEKIRQIQRAHITLQLFDKPVKVYLDSFTKRIITNCHFKVLDGLNGQNFSLVFA